MEIHVLDKSSIDKIAAGEVVERPVNVVKELMENSIDSGATAISVDIRDGGKSLIRITDNGCGIPRDQVRKAFLRHSTSKIRSADDLSFVTTLGFRGEALSSIAAVSEVELCTKPAADLTGTIYKISGGEEISMEDAGLPDGTTLIISNLFSTVPARLKFLSSAQTEGNTITEAVEKIAMSHPEIAIKFSSNGKLRLNTSGNGSLKDVIYSIYGKDLANNLLQVHYVGETLSIDGFIGKPEVARSNRAYENFFVNGRFIKDKILSAAAENAFRGYQMKGTYPFTAFNVQIEPELMDVNVHPSKLEIRFYNNEEVYNCIYGALSDIINHRENIPSFTIDTQEDIQIRKNEEKEAAAALKAPVPEPFENTRREYSEPEKFDYSGEIPSVQRPQSSAAITGSEIPGVSIVNETSQYGSPQESSAEFPQNAFGQESAQYAPSPEASQEDMDAFRKDISEDKVTYEQQTFFDNAFISEAARKEHKIIGEIFHTYWIVEYDDKMYIIDQHAAHEKVLYEKFMARIRSGSYTSQYIAPGMVVTLSANEEACLLKYLDDFTQLGFEIEHFGKSDYIISAVPSDLYGLNNANLFLSFLDELTDSPVRISSEMLMDRIATAACKAAVKGGNDLSLQEANTLIDELLACENPYNCPHGRPTIITMSRYEMEKKFKRII